MKKLIPVMLLLALGLSSCAVKTVTRKELLTPTLSTAMDSSELTDMKYYGCDAEYDYFTRGYTRYRVLKSENCLPESARFTFNNWQGGSSTASASLSPWAAASWKNCRTCSTVLLPPTPWLSL